MDPRLASLSRLRSELEQLVGALDGARSDPGSIIPEAWRRCQEAFGEFQELDRELRRPGERYPAEVGARVEEAMRLHAIAERLAHGVQETIGDDRRRLAKVRAHLAALTGDAQIGSSCNVSG